MLSKANKTTLKNKQTSKQIKQTNKKDKIRNKKNSKKKYGLIKYDFNIQDFFFFWY